MPARAWASISLWDRDSIRNTGDLACDGSLFALIYRVKTSKVQIVAVAHDRRQPGYWMRRK